MKNLRQLSLPELQVILQNWGYKKQQAITVYQYLWHEMVVDIMDMKSLSTELLDLLSSIYFIPQTKIHTTQYSEDGTVKCSVRLHDNYLVEAVLIPASNRITVCVSSQVGCSLSCKFCATGYMERKRNVGFDELVDQVVLMNNIAIELYKKPISNVVFMGMGEPLLNYNNVLRSIEKITDQRGLSIAPRRITISTAGVAKMIRKLGDENVKLNLALSLHAANDIKRNEIMPINETNNLEELIEALNYFYSQSKNEITLEYILLRGVNDSLQDADELIAFYKKVPVHLINILEYNTISNALYEQSSEDAVNTFVRHLHCHNINAHLRRSRGKDIDAACGQLANVVNIV
jgi:23S rRNA (adenine2503-C2)-methyltransferase